MYVFEGEFVNINENKVVCIWKFKKKWEKLKRKKGYHVSKFYFKLEPKYNLGNKIRQKIDTLK